MQQQQQQQQINPFDIDERSMLTLTLTNRHRCRIYSIFSFPLINKIKIPIIFNTHSTMVFSIEIE